MVNLSRPTMEIVLTVFTLSLLLVEIHTKELFPLDDYILHHEGLNYDTAHLHNQHLRSKRSFDETVSLSFKAYGRNFNLNLKPDLSMFGEKHELDVDRKKSYGKVHIAYKGHLEGVPDSHVTGTILNGIFQGEIDQPDTPTFYIEPSYRFLDGKLPYHSIIYSHDHLEIDPYKHIRGNKTSPCAHHSHHSTHEHDQSLDEGDLKVLDKLHRYRRAILTGPLQGTAESPNTCYLELQSDPMLWRYMTVSQGLNEKQAKDEIMSLFVSHVNSLNTIFQSTRFSTFDDSKWYTGLTFIVQRSQVMTWEGEKCGTNRSSIYCKDNFDVNALLYQSSLSDHSNFCLSYLFTYRDFQKGTLGLAWVAKPSAGLTGGICEPYRESIEANNQKVFKSLNTGVVSLLNYGKRVAVRVSQLTFAHEVGHSFGSEHDSTQECAPFGTSRSDASKGNYIMYSSANPGNLDNNNKFSPCSRDYIAKVLYVVVNNLEGKRNCFNQSGIAYCGNGLVEGNEECDCGFSQDCTDTCCNARTEGQNDGCTLRSNNGVKYQCSPSQGPCCQQTCNFVSASDAMLCSPLEDCAKASYCNGISGKCPKPEFQPNDTFCDSNKHVCQEGQCIGSICSRIDWEECFLDGDWKTQANDMCYVSCKDPATGNCISTRNTDAVREYPAFQKLLLDVGNGTDQPVQLAQGSPCKNYQGYCDVYSKCRKIDTEGAFKNLLKFFDASSLEQIRQWIEVNWWAVMLMCIGLVLCMALFIKLCSYSTPTENPNKKKTRRQHKEIREVSPLQDSQQLQENPVRRHNLGNPGHSSATSQEHQFNGGYAPPRYYGGTPPPKYDQDTGPPRYDPYRNDFQKNYRRY